MPELDQNRTPIHQSPAFGPFLAVLATALVLWVLVSGFSLLAFFSVLGTFLLGFYFLTHFERVYFLFAFVIIFPLALAIGGIVELRAYELVIPGLGVLQIVRRAVRREPDPDPWIIPLPVAAFFILGLVSYLRHPGIPTQVFSPEIPHGNFRMYWRFFIGLMTYVLAYRLFQNDRNRKILVLVKLLIVVSVSGLLIQFISAYLKVKVPVAGLLIDWGPVTETGEIQEGVFRGWAFGWFGLFLFLILISFSDFPKSRQLKLFYFVLALTGMILSGARSILLAAVGATIFCCYIKKQYLRVIIPLSIVAVILAVSYSCPGLIDQLPRGARRILFIFPTPGYEAPDAVGSALLRIAWWREALNIISQHPFRGMGYVGLGVETRYLSYVDYAVRIGQSHNAYIATGVMLGLPGMLFLIWIFGLHLKRVTVLSRESPDPLERNINTWLTLMIVGYAIIYLFAGSPQSLFSYFLYAGLINLNWRCFSCGRNPAGSLLKDRPRPAEEGCFPPRRP